MSFVLLGWMTHILEPAIIGLIGIYLAWALGVVPFPVAFAGFSNTTPWFLFGAMLFGMMATKSGLARRLAFSVMRRIGGTYSRLLLGLIVSDFLLTLLVPSGVARVAIMGAVALGIIEVFGVARTSRIARGMFITLTYTATIFDKMVIAGAASITARGVIERVGQVEVLWSHWALAFLPVDLLTILCRVAAGDLDVSAGSDHAARRRRLSGRPNCGAWARCRCSQKKAPPRSWRSRSGCG